MGVSLIYNFKASIHVELFILKILRSDFVSIFKFRKGVLCL